MRQSRNSGATKNKSRGGRGGKPAGPKRNFSKSDRSGGSKSARPFVKRESRDDEPKRARKSFVRREDSPSPRFRRDDNGGEKRNINKDEKSFERRKPGAGKFGSTGRSKPGGKKYGSSSDRNRTGENRFGSGSDRNRTSDGRFKSTAERSRTGEERPGSDRYKRTEGSSEKPRSNRFNREDGKAERPRYDRFKREERKPEREGPDRFKRDDEKPERKVSEDRPIEKKEGFREGGKRRRVGDKGKPFEKRDDRPSRSGTGSKSPYERRGTKRGEGREERKDTRSFDKKDRGEKRETPWNRKEKHEFYGDRKKSKSFSNLERANENEGVRLNKYIANAGICSRREADELISAGVVSVNGKVVTEMGYKVNAGDIVKYNNETLRSESLVYILLNKPKDFITTTDDPEDRKTVMSLIAKACKERVYPVGRLDRNTTGILLFTNDGDLAKKLTHPSFQVHKVYQVELDRAVKNSDMEQIMAGVQLEDGLIKPDEVVFTSAEKNVVGMELHSGKNRIVRRIFEHLGYEVKKLDRVVFAGLTKKDLPRGRWRFLTEMEVANLKMMTGKGKAKPKPVSV